MPTQNIEIDISKLTTKVYPSSTGKWWLFFQAFTTGTLLLVFYFMTT